MSNLDYILLLNSSAGRSFNNLSQYPIVPWILANYSQEILDLNDEKVFRDLSKPIGVLKKDNQDLQAYYRESGSMTGLSYHHATHYSAAAIVLHFLIRLEPFTQFHWKLNNAFDNPNRIFHNIGQSWRLTGAFDVRELIPEFFFLPEFLQNGNLLNLGVRSNGEKIHDVLLPVWAHNDPREFIRVHRQAFESPLVSAFIHEWIDLIFGFKQNGPAAIESLNVFKPNSYESRIDLLNSVEIKEIREFGLTPRQLFTKPHVPKIKPRDSNRLLDFHHLIAKVDVSSTGNYVNEIALVDNHPLVARRNFGLCTKKKLCFHYMLPEGSVHICTLSSDLVLAEYRNIHFGMISALCSSADGSIIITGGQDCLISVWSLKSQKKQELVYTGVLVGHLGTVNCLSLSERHGSLISASDDGFVIAWDILKMTAQFALNGFKERVVSVQIDDVSGDVLVTTEKELILYTLNGRFIASHRSPLSAFSSSFLCSIGSFSLNNASNLIITGHLDGSVCMWTVVLASIGVESSRTIPELTSDYSEKAWQFSIAALWVETSHHAPVVSVRIDSRLNEFWTGDSEGMLCKWAVPEPSLVESTLKSASLVLKKAVDQVQELPCHECQITFKAGDRRYYCKTCPVLLCRDCGLPHIRKSHRPSSKMEEST